MSNPDNILSVGLESVRKKNSSGKLSTSAGSPLNIRPKEVLNRSG